MSHPPLNYQTPTPPDKNRPRNVFLRILAGSFAGGLSAALGAYIFNITQSTLLGLLPILILFAIATYISLRFKRHGYAAGILLAPFIISAVAIILCLIICGVILVGSSVMHH
ncbi:MAG: hypothetical protein ACTHN5_06455 [Phycisphaerae bacterium]